MRVDVETVDGLPELTALTLCRMVPSTLMRAARGEEPLLCLVVPGTQRSAAGDKEGTHVPSNSLFHLGSQHRQVRVF